MLSQRLTQVNLSWLVLTVLANETDIEFSDIKFSKITKKLFTLKMTSTHDADRRQTSVRRHRRHASAYVTLACCTSVTVFKLYFC